MLKKTLAHLGGPILEGLESSFWENLGSGGERAE